ncbi:hypothetical protein [Streptomyces sp. AC627_RSS907]|uniref:hypothetical protein n=1 Tax=Streptomyces sp. AC627_RSS907 TaxID=2823684 RepID=UPI001C21318F|nr:hypothetical protein [Streptomyces sp. AC627_RSS907]
MRGLTDGRTPGEARKNVQATSAVVAVFVALGVCLSGCGAGGTGARDEGPAHADAVGKAVSSSPAASPSKAPDRVDAVRLVKADPKVSPEVKRELKPCVADEYPVDVSYGKLTGGSAEDVLVNVLTCDDAVGVGSYVYRRQAGAYQNVFKAEEPPVYAEIDRGDLVVTKQVYEKGDRVSSPSGDNVITYRWSSDRFTEEYRTHNDYSNSVGETPAPAPEG